MWLVSLEIYKQRHAVGAASAGSSRHLQPPHQVFVTPAACGGSIQAEGSTLDASRPDAKAVREANHDPRAITPG